MHTKEIVSFKRNPGRRLSLLKAIGKSNNCLKAVFCEKRDAIEKVVRLQWFHPFTYLSNKPIIHPQSISD
jgi:hypothetical protein